MAVGKKLVWIPIIPFA